MTVHPHNHTEACPAGCARAWDVDGRTVTGLYKLVKISRAIRAEGRPPRSGDKPLLWWLGYHAAKATVQLLLVLAIFAVGAWAKHCGVKLPELP